MKIIVIPVPKPKPKQNFIAGRIYTTDKDELVLCTEGSNERTFQGVALNWSTGFYSKYWVSSKYYPFKGEIKIDTREGEDHATESKQLERT